jgi:predicted ATPase/DNA-binding CsgD family transcriptional regulator
LIHQLRHNLPTPLTPLIGRTAELDTLRNRLADPTCRLITVTGVGGVGKTRLAIEVAHRFLQEHSTQEAPIDGVFIVTLAALADQPTVADAFASTIGSALGLAFSGPDPTPVQLQNYLSQRSALLVLDNIEHLLAGVSLIERLLERAPRLQIVTTSRVQLGLRGEWVIALEGLAAPPEGQESLLDPIRYPAVELFLRTAQAYAPDIGLQSDNIAAVGRICRMVEGLPMGIELAASWSRFMSAREIADEIAQSFDFLSASGGEAGERHQSMRAVFLSSWELLTEAEQRSLRRLAIFSGSFTRAAAIAVTDTNLPQLASLVSKSLVRRLAESAETRYILPETLRPYASYELERSGEAQEIAGRHSDFYLQLLAERTRELIGPHQPAALAGLSAEIAQIRVAWRSATVRGDTNGIMRAANGLFHIYYMRSWFAEGADMFGAARAALAPLNTGSKTSRLAWARLVVREGWFIFLMGRQRGARSMLEQSLAELRQGAEQADIIWALNYLGAICSYLGDNETTDQLGREALELADSAGDIYGRVVALSVLCQSAYEAGDYAQARLWGEQSLEIERQLSSPWSIAFSLTNLGKIACAQRDYAQAQPLFAQALDIRTVLGDTRGAAICLSRMGDASLGMGDRRLAAERYRDSLRLFQEIGNRWGIAVTLTDLARLGIDTQVEQAAARLLGEALALAIEIGAQPQIAAATEAISRIATHARRGMERSLPAAGQENPALLAAWAEAYGAAPLEEALATIAAAVQRLYTPGMQPIAQPRSEASHASLTSREVEVLQLVAAGLTDAQVADKLVISRRTVNAHLTSIYSKIGLNTRSAATRYALEHGLV